MLALVALAAWTGWRMGASAFVLRLLGAVLGIVLGLLLAGVLGRLLPPLSPVASLLLTVGCALGGLLVGSSAGGRAGAALHLALARARLGTLDRAAGAAVRGVVALVVLTVVAAAVAALAPPRWSRAIAGSTLLHAVPADVLPSVRSFVPADVAGLFPAGDVALPSSALVQRIADDARDGVLPVSAAGCGTGVTGTAFLAEPTLAVTNAHVVQGASTVSVGGRPATVVVDDRRSDLAVLRLSDPGAPFAASEDASGSGTPGVVGGYPGGGPERAVPAVALQRLPAPEPGLADGLALHESYRIRADVRHGNSGSPLLDTSGRVIGVVNGLSDDDGGFAITVAELLPDLRTAESATTPVATGACAS